MNCLDPGNQYRRSKIEKKSVKIEVNACVAHHNIRVEKSSGNKLAYVHTGGIYPEVFKMEKMRMACKNYGKGDKQLTGTLKEF